MPDQYIGGAWAGSRKRTTTAALTTAYQTVMQENAARTGFNIQSDADNTTNIMVRLGDTTDDPEYEITPGGGFSRNNKTGAVTKKPIQIKGASGNETFYAEEN